MPGRSQPDGVTLPMRVGGCLSSHWRRWQEIGAKTWVVTVLRDGYRVPFKDSPPPLARTPVSFPTYRAGSPRAQALRQEVEAMLAKGALEIARDPGPGFYSRLFLVEKATGGSRPVIDLSHLNDFVQLTPFKMETVASVLLSVREGDFLASLDLKDAYFQIPIHYCSLVPDPQAVFEDAFRHPWDDLDLYAFPPFALVGRVIARVQQSSRVAMTLVAPLWPEKEWFADLLLLLTQPPLVLPCWDRLLRQPHCNLFHQGAHALNLHAWRLSSDTTESRAFREGLLESCQGSSENLPLACTSRDGRSSVVGVVEGALLQSTPLFL